MTLLQSNLFLLGLPFLVIPVLIHLINRMRFKEMEWAAMMFLLKAKRSSKKMARLRELLILLFRTLMLLFLLIAFSKPLLTGLFSFSGPPDSIVIILDRSQSMETEIEGEAITLRQKAKRILRKALSEMNPFPKVTLIDSITLDEFILLSPEDIDDEVILGPTHGSSDFTQCMDKLVKHLTMSQYSNTQVWIASDSQASDWKYQSTSWKWHMASLKSMPNKIIIRYLSLKVKENKNYSVKVNHCNRYTVEGESFIDLNFSIISTVNLVIKLPVTIKIGDQNYPLECEVDAQDSAFRKTFKVSEVNKNGWGRVELPSDSNESDNQAYFAWGREMKQSVLVLSDSTFVKSMLVYASNGDSGLKKSLSEKISISSDLNKYALIVQHGLPLKKHIPIIEKYVEAGGWLLLIPNGQKGEVFSGLSWADSQAEQDGSFLNVESWQKGGLLAAASDGRDLPLEELKVYEHQPMLGSFETIATLTGGEVWLGRKVVNKGVIAFFTSLPERESSNLVQGHVLVPLLSRLMNGGAQRFGDIVDLNCGDKYNEKKLIRLDKENQSIRPTLNSGVYQDDNKIVSLNIPSSELQVHSLKNEQIKNLFSGVNFNLLSDEYLEEAEIQLDISKQMYLLALLMLVFEGLLSLSPKSYKSKVL